MIRDHCHLYLPPCSSHAPMLSPRSRLVATLQEAPLRPPPSAMKSGPPTMCHCTHHLLHLLSSRMHCPSSLPCSFAPGCTTDSRLSTARPVTSHRSSPSGHLCCSAGSRPNRRTSGKAASRVRALMPENFRAHRPSARPGAGHREEPETG